MMISKWLDENSVEYVLAITYAEGKGRLFEMFFGWRGSYKNGLSRVVLPQKGWATVAEMAQYYRTFCNNK